MGNKSMQNGARGGKTGLVGRMRSLARRALCAVQGGFAFSMRRATPVFEKTVPPLGRGLREWGWIWQPTYSPQWLQTFYEKEVDPYHFDGTSYEAGKYAHTMKLLADRRYGSALEIGAAEGIFTQMLAPHCDALLAVEVAEAAVVRAKERLAEWPDVTFVQATLPNQKPEGEFDLIVASDVLYYFPGDVVLELLAYFEERLKAGGVLFALHYLGNFRQAILGREVHELIKKHTVLELVHEETVEGVGPRDATDGYTISIFRKRGADSGA